jgi:hypothetical protein
MKRTVLAALAIASAAFVPGASAARDASPCAHVSRVLVGSTLGLSITATRSVPSPGALGLTVCYFETSTNPVAVSIGFQTLTGKKTYAFDLAQTGNLAKPVSGLGDKSFYNTSFPGGSTSLQVLTGNTLISFVTPSPLSKVEKLAKKIVRAS